MSAVADTMENITLRLENDAVLSFRGRLFSEAVWNDEDSGVFTHQKLYVTDQNEHVYVIRKGGERRLCRAYRVSVRGERCVIYNGRSVMELPGRRHGHGTGGGDPSFCKLLTASLRACAFPAHAEATAEAAFFILQSMRNTI